MMSRSGKELLVAVALVLATVAVYWQVRQFGFVDWDDPFYVFNNPRVLAGLSSANVIWAFGTLELGNWHPLTWLSHMTDCTLFGLRPGAHHLVNVGIHCANTVLIFFLLQSLTREFWKSALVAALFALHPLHVESVAWISERKDVLSAFFWILTLQLYVRYLRERSTLAYLLCFACFALGIMAKPMVVTLPLVLMLLDYWPLERIRLTGSRSGLREQLLMQLREKGPFLLLSLVAGLVTVFAQKAGGAVATSFGFGHHLGNAVISYYLYLYKTFVPHSLAAIYPLPAVLDGATLAFSAVMLLAISALALATARRCPFLLVGWGWYLITLLPVIGLFHVGKQAMADRYTYIPSIGVFIAVAWGIALLSRRFTEARLHLFAGSALVLALLSLLSWQQVGYWRDSITLFRHATQVVPDNFIAHHNLALALEKEHRYDEALQHYQEALRLYEDDITHVDIGILYSLTGRPDQALAHFREALRRNPSSPDALFNLGVLLEKRGDIPGAHSLYLQTLRVNPGYPNAALRLRRLQERYGTPQ